MGYLRIAAAAVLFRPSTSHWRSSPRASTTRRRYSQQSSPTSAQSSADLAVDRGACRQGRSDEPGSLAERRSLVTAFAQGRAVETADIILPAGRYEVVYRFPVE